MKFWDIHHSIISSDLDHGLYPSRILVSFPPVKLIAVPLFELRAGQG